MIAAFLALAAAQYMANSPPGAPPDPPTNGGSGFERPSRLALELGYEQKAKALKAEMHAQQKADGGTLTTEHLAYFRQKAEALLTAYSSDVRRDDPMSINADGSRAR